MKRKRKNVIYIMVLLFFAIILKSFSYPESSIYYPFSNTDTNSDYSGNENDLESNNDLSTDQGWTELGNDESATTSDNTIEGVSNHGAPISITFWFQPTNLNDQIIVNKNSDKNNADYWQIGIEDKKIYGEVASISGNKENIKRITSETMINLNNWYSITFTISSNNNPDLGLYIYNESGENITGETIVNDEKVVLNNVNKNNSSPIVIGGEENTGIILDEFRVYDTAITSEQVETISTQTKPGDSVFIPDEEGNFEEIDSDLVLYYKFDGNTQDTTFFNNHGSNSGATLTTD
ncbi:MAG: LamG-like jellyroll fold domain-containing protein, partial [Fusobacteriota bacterium]